MKKKLLFVIPSLSAGGAEKSLVNLVNVIDPDQYEVDLFLFSTAGLFMNQLPDFVKVLPKGKTMETFQKPLGESLKQFLFKGNWLLAWNRVRFAQIQRRYANKSLAEQYSWKYFAKAIKPLAKNYDASIGFLEKSSIYFVVDLVNARSKTGFIHTYYTKLAADREFDSKYFSELDHLCAVSKECSEDLKANFHSFSPKISIVHNIVSAELIRKLSESDSETLPARSIISIGRLVELKGFDMAVEAARILKGKKITFHWYIIGEGPHRSHLENLIKQYALQDCFTLLGLRENPYPYIRQAEVFVQCSRYEGKSIAIDEAKILAKPILLTDFTTAKDQIENGGNGLIVGMNGEEIAEGILKYLQDQRFKEGVTAKLATKNFGTEDEIETFYKLIE